MDRHFRSHDETRDECHPALATIKLLLGVDLRVLGNARTVSSARVCN